MEAFRRRVAVHPVWWAAARAFDGVADGWKWSLIRVDGRTCVCVLHDDGWWLMATWLARSKLLVLLAAELCVCLHIS